METTKYFFYDIVVGEEGLLKGPFGSDLKKELYVPKGKTTYKVYLQENILKQNNAVGEHYISKDYYEKSMKRYAVKEGDFIVTCDGTLGEIFQLKNITEPGIISSSLLRITLDKTKCDEKFFPYFFKAKMKVPLITQANNSVLKHLPGLTNIRNFSIDLPTLPVQKKIASVLAALDDKIALNQRINRNLEELARLIYDYWFVQFDFPDKNGKPYKISGGKMVYNDQLKREIPESWEVVKFEDFIEIGNGKDHSHLPSGEIPVYGSGGFMRSVTEYLFEGESVLFPRKGTLNNVMYKNEKFWTVDTMFYSRMKMPKTAIYVYYAAKKFDFTTMNTGTGVPSMTSIIIKGLPIIRPPQAIIEKFDSVAQSFYRSMLKTEKEIAKLTTLRDQLLPLLMNGQVSVEKQP